MFGGGDGGGRSYNWGLGQEQVVCFLGVGCFAVVRVILIYYSCCLWILSVCCYVLVLWVDSWVFEKIFFRSLQRYWVVVYLFFVEGVFWWFIGLVDYFLGSLVDFREWVQEVVGVSGVFLVLNLFRGYSELVINFFISYVFVVIFVGNLVSVYFQSNDNGVQRF